MNERNRSEPAFPKIGYIVPNDCEPEQWVPGETGMTLLDYFAAHAPPYPFKLPEISLADAQEPAARLAGAIAQWNYAYARAMLAQREKQQTIPY